jgi:predicted ATP-grasp superfamily ATP-dependent carboligase
MRAASINEIKQALGNEPSANLLEICLRLAKFKKENKELLTYLLFEEGNEQGYISAVKNEMEEAFACINSSNLYFAKKTIRKILRLVNKYARYSGEKETEVQLLLHFCRELKKSGIPFQNSTALENLYQSQLKKIEKIIAGMEEDLQYDYNKMLKEYHLSP